MEPVWKLESGLSHLGVILFKDFEKQENLISLPLPPNNAEDRTCRFSSFVNQQGSRETKHAVEHLFTYLQNTVSHRFLGL